MLSEAPGFKEFGFAPGVLRGARSWRVIGLNDLDMVGSLSGMFYRQVWKVGENHALCLKTQGAGITMLPPHLLPPLNDQIKYDTPERGHLPYCRCGFYAYYDGSNDYYQGDGRFDGLVTGMIEGYGEVLIGQRGFRCTKARIVALMIDPKVPAHDYVLEKYPGIPVFHDFAMMERAFPNEDGGAREQKRVITLKEDE